MISKAQLIESVNTQDRNKLIFLRCCGKELKDCLLQLDTINIPTINIGKCLSEYLDEINEKDIPFEDIPIYLRGLIEDKCVPINLDKGDINIVAIYNTGFLVEPILKLNLELLFSNLSREYLLVIVYEYDLYLEDINCHQSNSNVLNKMYNDPTIPKISYEI